MKPERVELIKEWILKNEELLSKVLETDRVEITLSMKGQSVKAKITQYPD